MSGKSLKKAIDTKNHYKLRLILLTSNINPSYDNDYCLNQACYNGDIESVNLLISYSNVNVKKENNLPFILAIQSGNIDLVMMLLKYVDPSIPFYNPLYEAAKHSLEIVKILLDHPALLEIYNVKFRNGIPRGPILGIIRATTSELIRSYIINKVLMKYYYFKNCVKNILPSEIINLILEQ